MRVTTLGHLAPGAVDLGAIYASVEGVDETSLEDCLKHLKRCAADMGANAIVGMQLVQSQFQWNARTSLLATAVKE